MFSTHSLPTKGYCQRCRQPTLSTSMSYFNTEHLCLDCVHVERAHPGYAVAQSVERQHVLAGDYHFPGVGLPADLSARYPRPTGPERP